MPPEDVVPKDLIRPKLHLRFLVLGGAAPFRLDKVNGALAADDCVELAELSAAARTL